MFPAAAEPLPSSTGVKIDVEDDGRINIASSDDVAAQKAIAIIQELTATPEQDKVYMGRVERITDFGAFIEVMPYGVRLAALRPFLEALLRNPFTSVATVK